MWCRMCCAFLYGDCFLLRHGPVDFHFCNAAHHALWQKHRFCPNAYWILRSLPSDRAALLPPGMTTAEFLSGLEEAAPKKECSSASKAQ
jgi:hypothetical protein